jgi:hypothetical protein
MTEHKCCVGSDLNSPGDVAQSLVVCMLLLTYSVLVPGPREHMRVVGWCLFSATGASSGT